jgi:N-hydroxyarylamine O-acetyltransferase
MSLLDSGGKMDQDAYLARIGYTEPLGPTSAVLNALHRAHMHSVPFENLDISFGEEIRLDPQTLFRKIVSYRRGGFCYELNGLFAELLKQTGFEVTYLSARDAHGDGQLGEEFDHLALLVRCEDVPCPWLVDVGWGDSFVEPLRLDDPGEQIDGLRAYRLEVQAGYIFLWQRNYEGNWERHYGFTLQPRRFPQDFEAMCRYHQTSIESIFTQKRICTLATPEGRISLEGKRLITTRGGIREEIPVDSEDEFRRLLIEKFGILLDES